MHYYKFHIGDYAGHTQHLDEIEDLAYRRMLDYLYLNEIPLPESPDEIGRLIRMRTHSERIAIVLREFFTQAESGEWVNKRVIAELAEIHGKSEKAQESARKRWEKHHANASETHNGRNAIQEPRTKNQEPRTNIKTPSSSSDDRMQPDYAGIVDLYHQILPELATVKIITDKRKSAIRSCCNLKASYYGLDFWRAYFEQAKRSKFIIGEKIDWKADFDFLITKSKFVKVLEGSYD